MNPLLRKFLGLNWLLFLAAFALAGFGIYAIYSATWMRVEDYLLNAWRKQTLWLGISVVVFFVVSMVNYRWVKWGAIPLYLAGLAALILTRSYGKAVYGAKSWLEIGTVNFQPSQVAVIAGVLVLALCLSQLRKIHPTLRIALCGVIVAGPWALILLQPDLGSAIVWVPIFMVMLFVGAIPLRYLMSMILIALAAIPWVVNLGLQTYQRQRIMVFLNPDIDPLGAGWTINQSLTAVGSGGWSGKGFKALNTLNELGFLPSTIVHNDFIFAVIAEQHGFVGGLILVSVFGLLLMTGLHIALKAKDDLGLLVASGIVALLFAHVFMNIGMTIAITPITGLPLPLVSYGGSFLVMIMFSLGLLQSIWIHRKSYK